MLGKAKTLPQKAARLGILLCSAIPLAASCTLIWARPPCDLSGFLLGTATWAAILYSLWILRRLFMRLVFPIRLPAALVGLGRERQALYQAALALHWGKEDQAIALLEPLIAEGQPEVQTTARAWRALAAMRCFRQRRRLPLGFQEKYPELFVLLFGVGEAAGSLNRPRLAEELAQITPAELDELARTYTELIEFILKARRDRASAFHAMALDMTEYLTGCNFILFSTARVEKWWARVAPSVRRGGGPLLAGLRLIQHGFWEEGAKLLARLELDGLLSQECECVHHAAAFLVSYPPWRLIPQEIPHLFRGLHYCAWQETGLLRLPLATKPEIAEWCRRGRELRASKQAFIGDLLDMWRTFGHQMDRPLAYALVHLTGHPGRRWPTHYRYWRAYWDRNERFFEPSMVLIMDGIAATVAERNVEALRCFEMAQRIDPSDATSLVNQIYVLAAMGEPDAVRCRAAELLRRFPKDAGAVIALGQIFAIRLQDNDMAEKLFRRAHQLCPESADPLLLQAKLALAEGHYARSEDFFSQALQSDPSSIEAHLGLGRVHLETRRPDLAVQHLMSASQKGEGDLRNQADYLLYRAFRELNADRRAIECLERVPPNFFREPEELDDIAFHLESEQQYVKARVYAERAMLLRARGRTQDSRDDELRPT